MTTRSFESFNVVGMGLDPIHVGTGGARLGRVELTIVRDPVTRVPKIPGSSLAGVYRTYAAMYQEENRQAGVRSKPYFPDCAGQGQPDTQGQGGHCGQPDCAICTVFGFARGQAGGFAGLAAFSDAHILLFPVATRGGPLWVTCASTLRFVGCDIDDEVFSDAVYREANGSVLNLGWLLLEVKKLENWNDVETVLNNKKLPGYVYKRLGVVSDKLFTHIVNSNLEVRTSVSIDPATGAAQERALFSYEALPRTTVLVWTVTCRNPKHFKVGERPVAAQINGNAINGPEGVFEVVKSAHPYLEALGLGGMGTRGMGRLRVLNAAAEAPAGMANDGPGSKAQAETPGEGEAS